MVHELVRYMKILFQTFSVQILLISTSQKPKLFAAVEQVYLDHF